MASNGGPSQRFALRRSAALYLATSIFILVAVAAVCFTLASRVDPFKLVAAGLVTLLALTVAAQRSLHHAPGSLKIGPDEWSIWNRAGILQAQGRIVGCSQWSDRLLIVVLAGERGRSQQFLIAADSLSRDTFRELAVLARRPAHA